MTSETVASFLIVFLGSYIIGSIPFGVVSARIFKLGDLRTIGSGNVGATNVLRTGSKRAALFTVIGDGAKGALAVIIFGVIIDPLAAQIAAFGALVGHCYSVFLKFNGGKGVASFIGIFLALEPKVGVCACLTWLVITALFRISSLSAVIMAVMVPLWLLAFGRSDLLVLSITLAMLLWFRHHANIQRLIKGTEPKIKL